MKHLQTFELNTKGRGSGSYNPKVRYMYPINDNSNLLQTVEIFKKTKTIFKLIRNTKVNKILGNNNINDYFIYFYDFNANFTDANEYYFTNRSYKMGDYEIIEDYGEEVKDIDLELNTLKYNL